MQTYTVKGKEVKEGIDIDQNPYPRIILGQGGHKRATWIPLGKRDADRISSVRMKPCPKSQSFSGVFTEPPEDGRCPHCGVDLVDDPKIEGRKHHPLNEGEVEECRVIKDVGVIALKNESGEYNGKHLIVAPRGSDDRVLVLWSIASGYRGSAQIVAGDGVKVVAYDHAYHSGRGALGITAEMLCILQPGQELRATISGRRVQNTCARLSWDRGAIKVEFGDSTMYDAEAELEDGDFL